MKAKYKSYLGNLGSEVHRNPKKFWSFFKSKTGSSRLPCVLKSGTNEATTPKGKADMFNKYFHSVFTSPNTGNNLPDIPVFKHPNLGNFVFTNDEILEVLSNLDCSKAYGPDGISPVVLRRCAHELAPQLTALFNQSLRLGWVPTQWKDANVCPVLKKGRKEFVENYRPISLLSIVSKVMERCMFNRIFPYLKEQIHPFQHGFIKGRSTATLLLQIYHKIGSILDNGGQVDVVLLDFSKAFDCVSHRLLVHKLKMYGVHSNLLAWFKSYLSCRRQRVIVENVHSDWLPVVSGVPQGSILGPLLFLLFINDLPYVVSNTMALYADDSKCFKQISTVIDCVSLQKDIENMYNWGNTWMMKFNTDKCKILTIGRGKNQIQFQYKMEDRFLEVVSEFNDLGVSASGQLTWKFHIQNIISKANSTLGFIKRSVGFHAPLSVKKALYMSLVRSKLEYCSTVWSPHTHELIERLESVQRRGTKFILNNYQTDYTYKDRLLSCSLLPLSYRREILDLVFIFKCFLGYYEIDVNNYLTFPHPLLRSHDQAKLTPGKCNTTTFMYSFFLRIAHIWNSLPTEIRQLRLIPDSSIRRFKQDISGHYLSLLSTHFDAYKTCTWTTC